MADDVQVQGDVTILVVLVQEHCISRRCAGSGKSSHCKLLQPQP